MSGSKPVPLLQNAEFSWIILCYLLSKQCTSSSERYKFLEHLSLEKIKSYLLNQENEEVKDNIQLVTCTNILSHINSEKSKNFRPAYNKYQKRSDECKEYQTTCHLLITERSNNTKHRDLRNIYTNQISMYLQWHIEQWNTKNPKHRILFYNNPDEEISLIEKTRSEVDKYEKSEETKQVIEGIEHKTSESLTNFSDIAKLHAAYLAQGAQHKDCERTRRQKKIGPQSVDLNDSNSSSPDSSVASAKRAKLTTQTTETSEAKTSNVHQPELPLEINSTFKDQPIVLKKPTAQPPKILEKPVIYDHRQGLNAPWIRAPWV